MNSFHLSKETQDKVKLAKKFIQDKYQNLFFQQKSQKQSWQKIKKIMKKQTNYQQNQHEMQKQMIKNHLLRKRLMRQKDSLKNYHIFQLIGKGAFGQVRIARNKKSNEIVAIKRIQKKKLVDKKQLTSAYIEKELMIKNNDSNFLIKLHSTFQDRNHLYLVMDYAAGGDLLHLLIQKDIFTEEQTKFYIAEMIVALEEMQSRNIIHRDIKPDNILIDKHGHIKISDFGLSKHIHSYRSETLTKQRVSVPNRVNKIQSIATKNLKNLKSNEKQKQLLHFEKILKIKQRTQKTFSKVGTPDYISPQVLFSDQYDYSVDIWSVGVIMFECLFGYPPFSDQNPRQICKKVVNWNQNLVFPSNINVSLDAKLLILGMINERCKRMTISKIKEHSFFKGVDWSKIKEYQPPMIPQLEHELDTRNFQQYEETQGWIDESEQEKENNGRMIQKQQNLRRVRSSAKVRSTSADYLFAGFDYRNVSIEPFQIIANEQCNVHKVKKQCQKQPLKFIRKSHQKQKNPTKRVHTQNRQESKYKKQKENNQRKTGKIKQQKYLLNKTNSFKNNKKDVNSIQRSYVSFLGSFSGQMNSSVLNMKEKSLLMKESKLKQSGKALNFVKSVNKVNI